MVIRNSSCRHPIHAHIGLGGQGPVRHSLRETELAAWVEAGHAPMIGFGFLVSWRRIEYPFIFGLEQAGPESNSVTPAQLDAIDFASKRLLEVHS
jgi:hypothetical protein